MPISFDNIFFDNTINENLKITWSILETTLNSEALTSFSVYFLAKPQYSNVSLTITHLPHPKNDRDYNGPKPPLTPESLLLWHTLSTFQLSYLLPRMPSERR
jgi:hypothetical protein